MPTNKLQMKKAEEPWFADSFERDSLCYYDSAGATTAISANCATIDGTATYAKGISSHAEGNTVAALGWSPMSAEISMTDTLTDKLSILEKRIDALCDRRMHNAPLPRERYATLNYVHELL